MTCDCGAVKCGTTHARWCTTLTPKKVFAQGGIVNVKVTDFNTDIGDIVRRVTSKVLADKTKAEVARVAAILQKEFPGANHHDARVIVETPGTILATQVDNKQGVMYDNYSGAVFLVECERAGIDLIYKRIVRTL